MERILAIETSTPVCSVALQTEDGRVTEKRMEGRGVHSEYTVQFIEELLDRAGLEVENLEMVLFSNGPGSYTGLRIGAALLKGLLFRKNVSLKVFPTLISFAAGSVESPPGSSIHAVIDARRNHLYHQRVSAECTTVTDPEIVELDELAGRIGKGEIVVGTGWERLEIDDREKIRWIGREGISAVGLIRSWNHPILKKYFRNADVADFEPDYLSMSQINNSTIEG